MNSIDPRAPAAFDAAISHIKTTAAAVADRVADHLGTLASAAGRIYERDALIGAQLDLRRHMSTFVLVFGDTLSKRLARELQPQSDSTRRLADTDWQSLSLVGDDEVEERMFADRIATTITHECEWELRDVAAYSGALLGLGRADQDRNPLRPEVIGSAVYKAIEAVSNDSEGRKLMAREMGTALGRVMPSCYAEILKDLRVRGIVPVALTVRGVEGPGNELARDRVISGYSTLQRETGPSTGGAFGATAVSQFDPGAASTRSGMGTRSGLPGSGFGRAAGLPGGAPGAGAGAGSGFGNPTGEGRGAPGNGTRPASTATGAGASAGTSRFTARPGVSAQADAELMTLLRRLTVLATRPGELNELAAGSGGTGRAQIDIPLGTGAGALSGSGGPGSADSLPGLMAVNLIRAHREELRQASTGALDHMVIDVVGSLFDQILSDPRVPPQMARQIARLQLPVLRVALGDPSFFSSRKHPVRRFVNRLASLACAFDEFDDGPGKLFLQRVRDLVQEIVDGDFDQIEVYQAKLGELEQFIAQSSKQNVESNAEAVSLVDSKESDLRVQQRYMLQLRAALQPLSIQGYLRDFLAQVWSQALVLGNKRAGPDSDLVHRLRRVGRDLVLSVQPKGSPAMRKKFLMQLPMLMKDLNEGLALIGWPEAAQKDFFGKLLPAHAESLKGMPLSELEYNLLAKQLEGVFNTPVPEPDALLRDIPLSGGEQPIEPQFSPEEKQRIGLVEESQVNWSGEIDIDLSGGGGADTGSDAGPDTNLDTQPGALGGDTDSAPLDIDLSGLGVDIDLSASEPPEPTQGLALMDHIKLGFAYQMNVNDKWQKVRLSYVSPGRAFFVFTRGKRHQETVSLTARMLGKLCETGRFRAFERSYLLERATARARKQLAALSASAKAAAATAVRH